MGSIVALATASDLRQIQNFNQSWTFQLGDYPGAEATNYDDSAWENDGLPHCFSMPYFLWPQFYSGYGWYRKHFTVPADWAGERVSLDFDGVFQDAQVYVNGQLVGEHLGGYTGFCYDITTNVVLGDNVVAVRVNNLWNAQIAPRAGDFVFLGGIYRDAWLVVTDPLHVTWYGTFVTTPTLGMNGGVSSTVNIQTEIMNGNTNAVFCTVETDIEDANSNLVTTVSSTQTLQPGTTNVFSQTTPPVANPLLWSPAAPNLYCALTTVFNGTNAVDSYTTTFGFRWLNWTGTNGFLLNGSRFYFHGADVHQDHAGWGYAVADSALFRDVQMVKETGFNFIRGSHYPKAPAFADACDQLGVCFWSENCFWGSGAYGEGSWNTAGAYPNNSTDWAAFNASVTNTLADMIRIHRNHPSIVAWSMCNEPFFTAAATFTNMTALLTNEVMLTHQLDPTRPAAIGGAQRPTDSTRIDFIGDVAGYNGDGATISVFQDPGIPNMVTEYGSVSSTRPGDYDPGWGNLSFQLTNGFPIEYLWRSGQAVWCMFDHGSIDGSALETMGIVDYFRIPKLAWYWYRNAYAQVPPPAAPGGGTPAALQLAAGTTNLAAVDGTQDALITVSVLDSDGNPTSNSVPVTLTVTSGPGEFPTGTNITFLPPSSNPQSDISIIDSLAAIEFRTYYSGASVITATSPGLAGTNITLISQGAPAFVPGVSPPVPNRPYSRFTVASTNTISMTVALNRPTSATSSANGTASALANDGDTNTFWQAASSDTNASWQVFLEASYAVKIIELTFPTNANYQYTIDVSSNGTAWSKVVDQWQTVDTDQTRCSIGNFGDNIQYVGVNFTNLPAGLIPALAEVAVGGAQSLVFNSGQLGGTIIGTLGSYNNDGNTRELAMDWDMTTYFDGPNSSNGSNCWVGLDFGSGVSNVINQIEYCPRFDIPQRMVGGVFQGANRPDFSDAVMLFTVTAQPPTNALTAVAVTNSTPFRYVRYLSPVGGWGNVAEVQFYNVSLSPTNITWSAPTPITTADATLLPPPGQVIVGAATFGGTAYTVTLTNGMKINFTSDGSVATASGIGNATGAYNGNTGNANFNAALNEFYWDGGPKTITLNNLTPGIRYAVQFFGLDDRSTENLRQAYLQDPNLPSDVSPTWHMGDNVCVVGTFTASSSTQTIIEQLPGNDSGGDVNDGNANDLVLRMVRPTVSALLNNQDGTFTVSWSQAPNAHLQTTTNLANAVWTDLATNGLVTIPATGAQFFRAVVP